MDLAVLLRLSTFQFPEGPFESALKNAKISLNGSGLERAIHFGTLLDDTLGL